MYSSEEQLFIQHWQIHRQKSRTATPRRAIGLGLGVGIAAAVVLMVVSGWYARASAVLRSNGSVVIVILVALISIVVFFQIFSARLEWERCEQRYLELQARENKNNPDPSI